MILPDRKCIFVHVPKTAGKTIRSTITERQENWEKANHEFGATPHMDINQIKELMINEDFLDYFKFGFVRNPWDRAVSIFCNRVTLHKQNTFRDFVNIYHNTTDFCKWPSEKRYQRDWFTDSEGNVVVDFIGRFENLIRDLSTICETIGIPVPEHFAHEHERPIHRKSPYVRYYDDELREIIAQRFDKDIEFFDYKFGE